MSKSVDVKHIVHVIQIQKRQNKEDFKRGLITVSELQKMERVLSSILDKLVVEAE